MYTAIIQPVNINVVLKNYQRSNPGESNNSTMLFIKKGFNNRVPKIPTFNKIIHVHFIG